jgi:alpha-1,3-mannosyltransferase
MKVLHVTPAYFPVIGGIETLVRDLVLQLRCNGIIADVLHISPANKKRSQEHLDESTVWRVPLFPNRLIGVAPGIRPILSSYDVIHVHDPHAMALSVNVIAQGKDKKKVLSTHGGYFHTHNFSLMKKIHWGLLAGPILKHYDDVLASSVGDRDTFKAKVPNVKLVQNGVNVSKFASVANRVAVPATRWIYWGRISQNKRIDLLVDTVKRMRDAGLDVRLTVAGQDFDGLLPSLRDKVSGYGLNEYIRILGKSPSDADLLKEIAAHSVFITASEHEGFGISIIEAMAAGLVVICRNMSPINTFVTDRENGRLIDFSGSATELASLKSLCSVSPDELSNMSERSRRAAVPYSWESAIKPFIQVYEDVLRG